MGHGKDEDAMIRRMAAGARRVPEAQMVVARPLNDTQYLGLVAAMLYSGGKVESIDQAIEQAAMLTAKALYTVQTGTLQSYLNEVHAKINKEQEEEAAKQRGPILSVPSGGN